MHPFIRKFFLLAAAALLCVALVPASAEAHQSSFSYGDLELSEDGRVARYKVKLSTRDLYEALELGEDRDASDAEIAAGSERLNRYVFAKVQLAADQGACRFRSQDVRVLREGDRFAEVSSTLTCPRVISALELDYQLFFDLDPRHEGLLRSGGELIQLSRNLTHYRLESGRVEASSVVGFLRSGAEHVLYGLDHILFLVALLLVVCLRQGQGGGLVARGVKETLRKTGGIVTAFTIGHSLTLIVASLGWFTLPGRFVESMIAASIIFVAVENLLRPDPKRRYLITFAFGLMHGLGFASMLQPLLPPDAAVLPLLIFNVGVELGQLAIVAVSLPLLLASVRLLSAGTYRRYLLSTGCGALSLIGLLWFLERALELELVGI